MRQEKQHTHNIIVIFHPCPWPWILAGLIMLCTFSGEFQNKRMRSFLFLSAQVTSLLLYIPSDKPDFTTGDERHTTPHQQCLVHASYLPSMQQWKCYPEFYTPAKLFLVFFIVPKINTDMEDETLTHFLRVPESAIESSKRLQSHHPLTNHP